MEQNKKLSLKEEMENEARKIEEEIANNPDLEGIEVSDKLESSLMAAIQAYEKERAKGQEKKLTVESKAEEATEEPAPNFSASTKDGKIINLSEEDMEALRLGRELLKKQNAEGEKELLEVNKEYHKHLNKKDGGNNHRKFHMPRKKKLIVALVAVCVLVLGTGVTSVGSKSYWKVLWEKMHGEEPMQVTNVKDMDTINSDDGDEVTAYREIREKLGISPVRFGYLPEDMVYDKHSIDVEQGRALIFYRYGNEIIRYAIYVNNSDSSLGQKKEDELNDSFVVKTAKQNIKIKEYDVEQYDKSRYSVEFSYMGVNYQLKGIMEREEITKIVKDLKYFTKP